MPVLPSSVVDIQGQKNWLVGVKGGRGGELGSKEVGMAERWRWVGRGWD